LGWYNVDIREKKKREREKVMIDREKMIAEIQESFAKIGAKPLSEKRINEIIDEEISRFKA
jgi:hypothetical protein